MSFCLLFLRSFFVIDPGRIQSVKGIGLWGAEMLFEKSEAMVRMLVLRAVSGSVTELYRIRVIRGTLVVAGVVYEALMTGESVEVNMATLVVSRVMWGALGTVESVEVERGRLVVSGVMWEALVTVESTGVEWGTLGTSGVILGVVVTVECAKV